eukprot:m51a1_g6496 hypothetical protein (348) ;mRNA; f:195248-196291
MWSAVTRQLESPLPYDARLVPLLAEYLADTFLPIRIAVPASAFEASPASYSNSLFRAWRNTTPYLAVLVWSWDVSTPSSGLSPGDAPRVPHPAVYAAQLLGAMSASTIALPAALEGGDLVLDSEGKLPRRWLLMMADFWFTRDSGARVVPADLAAEQALLRSSARAWEARLWALPAAVLRALQAAMLQINRCRSECAFRVLQAPPYSPQQVAELLGPAEAQALGDRDREHVDARLWHTGSDWCSAPARAFFRRCERLLCIPRVELPASSGAWTAPTPYRPDAAHEGGIAMCYDCGPWRRLAPLLGYVNDSRCDLLGTDAYGHCYDLVPFDELVVLREALKAEGAVLA